MDYNLYSGENTTVNIVKIHDEIEILRQILQKYKMRLILRMG